ncbi:MAG: DGQHR domain-containing protein, partial [Chryseobacterium sp.]
VYGIDEDGYQRKPNKIHYNKIKNYALKEIDNFVLPTSIILGADQDYITSISKTKAENITEFEIDINKKNFRIVDGQHRIAGLREAAVKEAAVNNFMLNVIVVVSDPKHRSVELEIFSDINSRAKRINTDLAELARYDYQIKESDVHIEEINMHIGIKTAHFLKEQEGDNVWQNAIKFDIHSEVSIGIIGITLFTDSIKGIIDSFIKNSPFKGDIHNGQEVIDYCQLSANEIGKFLNNVWNKIIKEKWSIAFKQDIIKNDEGDLVNILYSKDYYVQKGIGVKSLNAIISQEVSKNGFGLETQENIKKIIFNSKVKIEHWKNGGSFAGFNSESGFSKIQKMILNAIPVE